jgi:O-antigen/teichoic acid export membrane protein
MLKYLLALLKSDFLKSSTLVFVTNNLINLFNYILIIIAIYFLRDSYGLWTSTSSFLAISSVPLTSFMLLLTKKVAEKISKDNRANITIYYLNIWKKLKKHILTAFMSIPVLVIVMMLVLKLDQPWVPLLVCISLLVQFASGLNLNFLLGILRVSQFSLASLLGLVVRFSTTIGFLYLGFGVSSLPLGLIISGLVTFLISLKFIFIKHSGDKSIESEPHLYEFKNEFKDFWSTTILVLLLAGFLNIDTILSRTLMNTVQNNQYSIISTFGQIAHFGPISFASLLIPYVTGGKAVDERQNKGLLILKYSLLAVSVLTLLVGLIFGLFGHILLDLLNKPDLIYLSPLIIFYTIFIWFYNLIYVCVSYLIAQANYILNKPLIFCFSGLVTALVCSDLIFHIISGFNLIEIFIILTIMFSGGVVGWLIWQIFRQTA